MRDPLSRLFADFDGGQISRRRLFEALGLAAAGAPIARAFGQGSCGGDRAGTPQCDTIPFKPPFEPTGWKTVLLDHFSLQVVDVEREAAYYNALMSWKVRSFDGSKAVLDMGEVGSVIIRGGLPVPPPPPPAPAGDSAGGGGRGGGGRGGRGGGRRAIWDGMCWGIEPWDTNRVEAALKARGLNPVADHSGNDFRSFHVKDPDGFDVQISNGNKRNRRTTPANGKLNVPPPFEATGWKTVFLDHISFEVTSYKESVAFYTALLGWKSSGDEGSQSNVTVSPEIGGLIIRGGNANAPAGLRAGPRSARMGHISFGLADFDHVKVLAELQKRGLNARVDTGGRGDIATAPYKSYHTTTPNGFDLQISNSITP